MIYGIGTDICDVRRIRASLDRHGERFAAKILSDHEMATWRQRSARWPERGVRYLATRFSAKEAFSKAIGRSSSCTACSRTGARLGVCKPA
jgi:holo-[acyl-carrier protein] synthase